MTAYNKTDNISITPQRTAVVYQVRLRGHILIEHTLSVSATS